MNEQFSIILNQYTITNNPLTKLNPLPLVKISISNDREISLFYLKYLT